MKRNVTIEYNDKARVNEKWCAYLLKNLIYKNDSNLIVGDDVGLPDIYSADYSIGYEVVTCALKNDLLMNGLVNKIEGEDDQKYVLENGKYKNKLSYFEINYSVDNKMQAIMEAGFGSKSIDYMFGIYYVEIAKKLRKLNNNNYRLIKGELNLVIDVQYRAKGIFDAKLFLLAYNCVAYEMRKIQPEIKLFSKLYFITSKSIFIMNYGKIEKLMPTIHQNTISYIEIEPNDVIIQVDYNYNQMSASKDYK